MTNTNTTANIFSIGSVIMGKDNRREFFREAILKINSSEYESYEADEEIQKTAEYIFAVFNKLVNQAYKYNYSVLSRDCCWAEINNNTTELVFILSRKETKKSDVNTLDFTDMVFEDCSQLTFNWLTDCESKIKIAPPNPREILLDYISNKPEIIKRKVAALLPLVDNSDIFQAIKVTKGDPNGDEIIAILNHYNVLKQNVKQD